MIHALKTHPKYFKDIEALTKTFEVRKNDRDFKTGDALLLQEYDPETKKYTGKEWNGHIGYILDDPEFVKKGFVILAIKPKEY